MRGYKQAQAAWDARVPDVEEDECETCDKCGDNLDPSGNCPTCDAVEEEDDGDDSWDSNDDLRREVDRGGAMSRAGLIDISRADLIDMAICVACVACLIVPLFFIP